MLDRLKRTVDRFNQTLVEGSYRLAPITFAGLIRGMKFELPATSEVAVGTTMIDTSKSWGSKFLWSSAIALLSINTLAWAAVGLGVVGIGVYTLEYYRAKNARDDVLTEVNFAGQRVKGARSDLYRLHRAQLMMMNVTAALDGDNAKTTGEVIRNILDSVKDERARVEVLDGGRYFAGKKAYAFSEPGFRLLETEAEDDSVAVAVPGIRATPSLKTAWDNNRVSADEFIERLAELQDALPQDMAEKLNARLQQRLISTGAANDDKTAPRAQKPAL